MMVKMLCYKPARFLVNVETFPALKHAWLCRKAVFPRFHHSYLCSCGGGGIETRVNLDPTTSWRGD